jgi:ribosomal protein S18 acetylase RimI-like enzyme
LSIVIDTLDITDPAVASTVLEIQRRSYRVEATLIGSATIPPLTETADELRACGEIFLGAFVDDRLAGIVSWKYDGETIDIHRLAVDPAFFRRGIGVALVRAVLSAQPDARRAIVQTGAANEPAKVLYRGEGFVELGERDVGGDVRVALFERRLQAASSS